MAVTELRVGYPHLLEPAPGEPVAIADCGDPPLLVEGVFWLLLNPRLLVCQEDMLTIPVKFIGFK